MVNVNLLMSRLALNGVKIRDYAKELEIGKTTLYRKLSGESEFSRKEIQKTIDFLKIDEKMAFDIFFPKKFRRGN
jgi:predicted transcriptional regulator